MLFGDGAGAVVVVGKNQPNPTRLESLGLRLYAEGAGHGLITIPAGAHGIRGVNPFVRRSIFCTCG